jgi:hypothetical protein
MGAHAATRLHPQCPVKGCLRPLLANRVLCYPHWVQVPRQLRRDLRDTAPWRTGNTAHATFFEAALRAAVAFLERQAAG